MSRRYLIGGAIVVAAGILTLAVKAALTKYPGIGDFIVFSCVVELLPSWLIHLIKELGFGLRPVMYFTKLVLGVLLYSILYLSLKKKPSLQLPLSVGLCCVALLAMSLGEVVVG